MFTLIRQAMRLNAVATPQLVRLTSSIQLLNESILTNNDKQTMHIVNKSTRSLFTVYLKNEVSLFKQPLPMHLLKRFAKKSKKSGKGVKDKEEDEEEEEDSDEEEEPDELAGLGKELGFQDRSTTVPSMRLDAVAKAGLGFTRARIEEMFYDNRIRLNGERVSKKSANVKQGDEIDAILGLNFENHEMLDVIRCEILEMDDKLNNSGRAKIKFRKHNRLVIRNYDGDPYTGVLINQQREVAK